MTRARQFLHGVRLFARGLSIYVRTPRLLVLGLIPTLVSAVLFVVAFTALVAFLPGLARRATWFAADWSPTARTAAVIVAGLGILAVALMVAIFVFTAVTLAIGDPFYERISESVAQALGGMPDLVEIGFWRGLWQSLRDSAKVLLLTTSIGVPLFFAGLLPVVGQTVVPVIGATVGGWFLALELVGAPLARRGLSLADRRRLLRRHRERALGFGTVVFLCFLIPAGAILLTPAAVIGATLLAREIVIEETTAAET